jgi:RNA-binding protein FUS
MVLFIIARIFCHLYLYVLCYIMHFEWLQFFCLKVGRIKQKRGYKDQWPWNIKIYTNESGKAKGDACLAYEDPSAAHSAGGFYNGKFVLFHVFTHPVQFVLLMKIYSVLVSDYDMRGYKISVVMAEKSAPRAPSYGHG